MPDQNGRARQPNWLATLFLLPALVLAALFGFVIFLVVLGAALLAVLAIMLRLWWLNRGRRQAPDKGVLEGEFVVVRESGRSEKGHRH